MKVKKPFHKDDTTMKYSSMAFRKRQHQYLILPGKYCRRYPNEVVLRDMQTGRMDELYSVRKDDEGENQFQTEYMLIDLEEESGAITEDTMKKYSKYIAFGSFIYSLPMYLAVICKEDYENFRQEHEITKTHILRPHYIYFSQEELQEKYNNINNKVKQNIKLTEEEALDIAFIPKYINKEDGPAITESLARLFKNAIIPDYLLRKDVAFILMVMILTHIDDELKQEELIEVIEMRKYEDDMDEIVYSRYGDKLDKKDQKIEKLEKEKENTIEGLKKLNSMEDLNTPQARQLLNTLIVQK